MKRNHHSSQTRPTGRQAAFTLVELLVCIAIIAILVSLLLPAVQFARESSRRIHCASNLRQLGIAIHLHADALRALPQSTSPFVEGPSPPSARDGSGWIVKSLPYLEQSALFQKFQGVFGTDFLSSAGLKTPSLLPAMQTRLPTLQCPSDGSALRLHTNQWQWWTIPVAVTNYKGVMGDNRMGGAGSMFPGTMPECIHHGPGNCPQCGDCNGMLFRLTYLKPVTLGMATDGLSATLMVGEDVPDHNAHSVAFYANGDYASCHAPLNYFPDPPTPDDWPNVVGFRSRHPGGANFCFGDGSVRFVNETIEYYTYRALSTRNGNEPVDDWE